MFLDIIHRPVFMRNTVLLIFENTAFRRLDCLRLQVEPTQLVPVDRASPYLRNVRSCTLREIHPLVVWSSSVERSAVAHMQLTLLSSRPVAGPCEHSFIIIILSGVRLSPLGSAATTGLLYQPQMVDDADCRAIGGMKFGTGNRSTRRKFAPAPLCPPQIPHDLTRTRTRSSAVGSQRLTTRATALPTR
jgi:hypothetical protein